MRQLKCQLGEAFTVAGGGRRRVKERQLGQLLLSPVCYPALEKAERKETIERKRKRILPEHSKFCSRCHERSVSPVASSRNSAFLDFRSCDALCDGPKILFTGKAFSFSCSRDVRRSYLSFSKDGQWSKRFSKVSATPLSDISIINECEW